MTDFIYASIEGGLSNKTSVHVSDKHAWVSDCFVPVNQDFLSRLEDGLADDPGLLATKPSTLSVAGLRIGRDGSMRGATVGSAMVVCDGHSFRSNSPGETFVLDSDWPVLVSTIGLLSLGESLPEIYKSLVNVDPSGFADLVAELGAGNIESGLSLSVVRFDPAGWR